MFDNLSGGMDLGANADLLRYERGKDNIQKLLPPKVAHEYQTKEKKFHQFLEESRSKLSGNMNSLKGDFSSGASGKSADKIKESLDEIGSSNFYSSTSFGF